MMIRKKMIRKIKKELAHHKHKAHHVGGPDHCQTTYLVTIVWANKVLADINEQKSQISKEYREMWERWKHKRAPENITPAPLYNQITSANIMRRGAWCIIVFEALLTALMSVSLLNLPLVWAALLGASMAILVAFFVKAALVPNFKIRYEEEDPAEGLYRVRKAGLVLLPAFLGLLFVVLITRGSSGAVGRFLGLVFWFTIAAWSIATLVLAGFLFLGVSLLVWSKVLSDEWNMLETLEGQIETLHAWCNPINHEGVTNGHETLCGYFGSGNNNDEPKDLPRPTDDRSTIH